jgi:hypothetical protein
VLLCEGSQAFSNLPFPFEAARKLDEFREANDAKVYHTGQQRFVARLEDRIFAARYVPESFPSV